MNLLTEMDKAYIAGFFDGEGCVGYYNASQTAKHRPSYFHTSVHVCNIDPCVIKWIADVTGIGRVNILRSRDKTRRTAYQWQIGKKADVLDFLNAIRPYIKVKSAQVETILTHLALEASYIKRHGSVTPEIVVARQHVSDEMKRMKWSTFSESVETRQAEPPVH